jgi:serine/threonine protein kinase
MAPEVHQGLGYSFSADIWSLGVLIYSLAIGYLPFGEGEEDPYVIFMAIQSQKPVFPPNFQNKKVKKLIKQLLKKESWIRPDLIAVRNL